MSTKTLEKAADDLNSAHSIKEPTIPAAATLARGVANKSGTVVLDAEASNPFVNLTAAQKRAILTDLLAAGVLDVNTGTPYKIEIASGAVTPVELSA